MSEEEWLACNSPLTMLEFVEKWVGERKRLLFSIACCRGVWHRITDKRSRYALSVLEHYLDGAAGDVELQTASAAAIEAFRAVNGFEALAGVTPIPALSRSLASRFWAMQAVMTALCWRDCHIAAPAYLAMKAEEADCTWWKAWVKGVNRDTIRRRQADLLREIVGNPFQPSFLTPCLVSQIPQVVLPLAQAIYDEQCFADLPVLADALEEAGCADDAILDHCRQPGDHVRGCWVVDLLLGKS